MNAVPQSLPRSASLRDERMSEANLEEVMAIENAVYDLKAVNPNRVNTEDLRTPLELLAAIAEKGREADAALDCLRRLIEEQDCRKET